MSASASFTRKNAIGTLALFCTMSEFAILTPSIAAFSHHFVGTDITTIMFANSITGIVAVPISIASGILLPRIGFRRAAIAGVLVMSLGGAFPFLLPNITEYRYVIASRLVVGVGLGLMFPVGNATIIAHTQGPRRARLLGLGMTVQFSYTALTTIAAGYLTEIAWNYSFLAYLLSLIPLIAVVAWMPEAQTHVAPRDKRRHGKRSHARIPIAVWGYALYALAGWTVVVTIQVVTSTVLDDRAIAGPGVASLVINCCGLGSIACGLAYPRLRALFNTRLFGAAAACTAAGTIPCLIANDPACYALGVFLLGFGGSTFFTAAQNAAGNLAPTSQISAIGGIMTSTMNLAPFLAPYAFSLSMAAAPFMGSDAIFPGLLGVALVLSVIGLVHPMKALMLS